MSLQRLPRGGLTRRELRDLLIFLVLALVVLPLVPDVRVGPYGAIHPPSIARLVVVLMAITGAGYVAERLVGARLGLLVTGFVAGFISSSAAIAALSVQARDHASSWRSAAAGALASNVATLVQYAVIVGAVDPLLAWRLAPALGLACAAALLFALSVAQLAALGTAVPRPPGGPLRLWATLGFAALVCVVSVGSAVLQERIGQMGIIVISAAAALVDAHATAGTVATLHQSQAIDVGTALRSLLVALSANSITKILLAWTGGHVKFGVTVTSGVLLVAGCAWLGW